MLSRSLDKRFVHSPRSWLTLLEVLNVCLIVEVGLRTLPFKRLLNFLARQHTRQLPGELNDSKPRLAELCGLAEVVFRRYPFNLTCLKRALILLALLRRRGIPAELKIGVTKAGEKLQAHAWLEKDGQPLSEDPDIRDAFPGVFSFDRFT